MFLEGRRWLRTCGVFLHLFASCTAAADTPGREALKQLGYNQVKLTGGPLATQYNTVHAHYLSLDNDRLLKVYRQNAGMPAPGADMGGWYDFDGFVPGSTLGQFVSGLARIGATTGDPACHKKVHDLVHGFAETLGPKNTTIMRPETNLWICYTLDKHFVGLIDAAILSNVTEAVPLLNRVLEGALTIIPAEGRDRIGKTNLPYDETYIMPENLFEAAALTGNPTFRDYAQRYLLNDTFFDILASGGNPLPGQHAYSHAIALSSGAKAYMVSGDTKYSRALEQAFQLLSTQQAYASGGWGPNETFVIPHTGELHDSLEFTHAHFETPCGTYAATKLARYLLRLTPSPSSTAHGDYLERVLFNTVLTLRLPDSDGNYPYYSNYSHHAHKEMYGSKWPCCSGTLVQTVADYPLNLGFTTDRGLYVNFYTPSTITFTHDGIPITVRQETEFPIRDTTTLTLSAPKDVSCTIALRIPFWAAGPVTITLNSQPLTTGKPGEWLDLERTWKAGDTLTLALPQSFRLEPIDDKNPDTVALMRGPVQYVNINPTSNVTVLPPLGKLRQAGAQVYTAPDGASFVPLYLSGNGPYNSYFTRSKCG